MLFSSLTFLFLFLPLTLILYYLLPDRARNCVLLFASLLFYAWGEPVYILLMLLSILANYFFGLIIGASAHKKAHLAAAVSWNLLSLGFFKYYGLLAETFPRLLPAVSVALPIGISFYTFQIISYLADVARGKVESQRNLLHFAVYVTMFPQLIAGPIVRYADVAAQIRTRKLSFKEAGFGMDLFIIGLSKKVLLANLFGKLYEEISVLPATEKTVVLAWIAALSYTFQIYFDFSGYSDMAVGLGHMLGFRFKKNFDYPYISGSITEFWRRWHISLGSWFREYVYIPLGGSRVRVLRHILNLMAVWMLTGLWHGASWNFLLWGLYYGILLVLEKYIFGKYLERSRILGTVITFFLTVTGWVIFANTSFSGMLEMFRCMFGAGSAGFFSAGTAYRLLQSLPLFVLGIPAALPLLRGPDELCREQWPVLFILGRCLLLLLCISALVYQSYNPFLYFRF